ncbi:unnamed protein product [Caenorhabditis angaria]|uniref:Uncharacterized protein n=1 Tax=Caenorhabditis angaria TaxID=860376 RepID=A0A9P1IML6_9PELO|nr:unnamed protein product [Caenorhabditis angaria]
MHSFSKIIFLLVGIGHLVLGIYTVIHLEEEQMAAAPIKAALIEFGDQGYTESNSQVKGVFMPFFVALFCLVVAVIPYNGVLYFLFILCLLEMGGFIWEMVAVNKINEQQTAHYILVTQIAKRLKEHKDKPHGRNKRFILGVISAVKEVVSFIAEIPNVIGQAINFVDKKIDTKPREVIVEHFGKNQTMEIVNTISKNPKIMKFYLRLAEDLETSKLLSEIGLGASIVTAVLVLGMTLFYTWEYKKQQSAMTFPPCDPIPPPHHSKPSPHHSTPSSSHYRPSSCHSKPSPHHSTPSSSHYRPSSCHSKPSPHHSKPSPHHSTPSSCHSKPSPHHSKPSPHHKKHYSSYNETTMSPV